MAPQNVVAVIFDFDDTLTDESTSKLLEQHGIDTAEFWGKRQNDLIASGWDPALAYLHLILGEVGEDKPLGKLSNAKLRDFGASLEFYQGIPEIFDDLHTQVKQYKNSNPIVEFYVISSGLEEIIRGSKIAPYLTEIWGSRFSEREDQVCGVMNAVSFTEKTKYIYAINKGITTEPNELTQRLHDRMPVILEPENYQSWLEADDPRELLRPCPVEMLTAFPVSTRVNTPKNNAPDLIDPAR